MDGLSAAASITGVIQIIGTVIKYLDKVKDADKDRTKLQNELSAVYGMLQMLQDQSKSNNTGDWNDTLRSLESPHGPIEQLHKALEVLSAELAPAEGLKKLSKGIKWPFKEKEMKDLFATIDRQKGLLALARQNDHIELSEAIQVNMQAALHKVDDISKGIAELQIKYSHDNIHHWLSAPDPSSNYQRALKLRQSRTGNWLLGTPAYIRWKASAGTLLWLYGIPGCGKTILSSIILENVMEHCHTNPKAAVLYFYFDFSDSTKQRHENMMRSLVGQLSTYHAKVPRALDSLFQTCGNGSSQPSHDSLSTVLRQMIASFEDVYIILDALDECDARAELLDDIEGFFEWEDIRLHVLSTSRREKDIEDSLQPLCNKGDSICLQTALVDEDIRSYVESRLQLDRRFKRWRNQPEVQLEILTELMSKAGGMFRWAVCQLNSLAKCLNLRQIRDELKSLPKDLDGTYQRILCGIDEVNSQSALKILQWLAYSARPLLLKEVAELVTIDVDRDPRVDPELRFPEAWDISTICSSLITVNAEGSEEGLGDNLPVENFSAHDNHAEERFFSGHEKFVDSVENPDQRISPRHIIVRLAHFSVKEYLISDRISNTSAQQYRVEEINANKAIAEMCLAYLLQFDSADTFTRRPPGRDLHCDILRPLTAREQSRFPLAFYAANFWPNHTRRCEEEDPGKTSSLSLEFLLAEGAEKENWIWLCCPQPLETLSINTFCAMSNPETINCLLDSPVHCSALLGLSKVALTLLERGHNIEGIANGHLYLRPLYLACSANHASVVKVLLDNGADFKFDNGEDEGQALHVAATVGSIDVMQLLIQKGADVNAQGGWRGNALQRASKGAFTDIVRLLIDQGADVNAQGRCYRNALQAASLSGSIDTIRLLIDRGADVNAQDGFYGNALQAASQSGSIDTVRLLIDRGADVNAQGGEYGDALQAVSFRMQSIRGRWLEQRADHLTHVPGQCRNTASSPGQSLVEMIMEKSKDVVSRLREKGASSEAEKYYNFTDIVLLLIEHGADVNAQSEEYGNVFSYIFEGDVQGISD